MEPISLNDHQDGVLSLRPNQGQENSDAHVEDQVLKYDAVLGRASPGPNAIKTLLTTGGRARLEQLAKDQADLNLAQTRNTITQQVINTAQSTGETPEGLIQVIQNLSKTDLQSSDIGATLETMYARAMTNAAAEKANVGTSVYDKAIVSDPVTTGQIMDRTEWNAAKVVISHDILDSLNREFDNSNVLIKGQAWLQTMVPFRSWIANNTLGVDMPDYLKSWTDILPGDSLSAQLTYLHSLPPDQYKQAVKAVVDRMKGQGDYLDAINFVRSTLQFGETEQGIANMWAGVDLALSVPVTELSKALVGVGKAVVHPVQASESIASTLHLMGTASRAAMTRALGRDTMPHLDIRMTPDVERAFIGVQRPQQYFTGTATHAPAEVLSRLVTSAQIRARTAMEILKQVNKVDRKTIAEINQAFDQTVIEMSRHFVDASSHIVKFEMLGSDNLSNIYQARMFLGKKDGSPFADRVSALSAAKRILGERTTDYTAIEEGGGWYIGVTRNVDETRGGILRAFDIETGSKNADTVYTRFKTLATIFGQDKNFGRDQQVARGVINQSVERMNTLLEQFAKPMSELAVKDKNGYRELDTFLTRTRENVDPVRGRGHTFETQAEFEDAFRAQFNKLPSEAQSDAYAAYKHYYDLETVIRSVDVYKQKAINGIERFRAQRRVLYNDNGKMKERLTNDLEFEGKIINSLPVGKRFKVAVLDDRGIVVEKKYFDGRPLGDSEVAHNTLASAELQKYIDDGYSIIQPYEGYVRIRDADAKPAKFIGPVDPNATTDKVFDYVIMRDFKRDRPQMNLVSGRDRMIQRYSYYIKQPNIQSDGGYARYFNDRTIANARDAVDSKALEEAMNRFRQAERARPGSGRPLFEREFPFWNYDDFMGRVQAGEIRLDVPFLSTRAGSRTIDEHANLPDLLNAEGHGISEWDGETKFRLSNLINSRFLGEQDNMYETIASEQGNFFELAHDSRLSPLETMKLSMNDLTTVNVMNDYKIRSANDFVQQFGHLIEHGPGEFQTNPLKFILEPKYVKNANPGEVTSAETIRKSIVSMWNHQTVVDRIVNNYKENLIRSLRTKMGDNVADWVDDKALPAITSVDRYMRGFAFHTKMGFFNPKQLFLQASTALNVIAISPTYGLKAAMLASPLKSGLYANESILRGLGQRFAKLTGMSADDYVEMVQSFKRSGFNIVGNDFAYIEDLSPPGWTTNRVTKAGKKILDIGKTPFDMGERWARNMAWSAAYMERKKMLKGAALTRDDEAWILWRAKTMTGNMTKESSSNIQRGWSGVATQFFGYQLRLMEQMLGIGGKLTVGERARLFSMMSMAYGVPVAASMTIGVLPIRTMMKDWMAEHNIDTNNTPWEPFIDGFASTLIKAMTGSEFNVSERYGPNGINTFYDLWRGDATISDLLAGASGGILWDTLITYDPILKYLGASMQTGDFTTYPINAQDFMDVFQQITTVNNTVKIWNAMNLGVWVTRNQNVLTDITPFEALISGVFGLDPERVSEMFNNIEAMDRIKAHKADISKQMVDDYRTAIRALRDGNKDLFVTLNNRVKILGQINNFTPKEMAQMYTRAANEEPLDEVVLRQFAKINGDN